MARSTRTPAAAPSAAPGTPRLLAGGNPQIAKGDGPAPVAAYLDALPGWKQEAGRRLDALVERTVPGVRKAVRWNSPFYGVEGQGWFLSFHCMTRYIKVTFLRGAALTPPPPETSKHPQVRYLHLFEGGDWETAQLAEWIRAAAAQPGDALF